MLFYITVCLLHSVTLHDVAHNIEIYISFSKLVYRAFCIHLQHITNKCTIYLTLICI